MRFKSQPSGDGYVVYAVTGVNSVSFAIDHTGADTKDLLGFAIERLDPQETERYYLYNAKVFREIVPNPDPKHPHTSFNHPVQSFVWDDFSVKPGYSYEYFFYPVKSKTPGNPKYLLRSTTPIHIKIKMETEYDKTAVHDVFFNRGVASSQAYANRFKNQKPDAIKDAKLRQEAFEWLSRHLDEAILKFIRQAKKGDALYACLYEFHYLPVVKEFAKAIKRGVDVKIIFDAKVNTDDFPRGANLKAMKGRIPAKNRIARTGNKSNIQHNKFIVFMQGKDKDPVAVWTGSTNISEGGIFGQTNVGHWIRDTKTAQAYLDYWNLLKDDPGNRDDRSASEGRKNNKKYKEGVAAITPEIHPASPDDVTEGITCIFSPRPTADMLTTYATLIDTTHQAGCITLAFGINKVIKGLLQDNTARNAITLMLLEKEDKPSAKSTEPFVRLGAKNNVYEAFGSYIDTAVYQFVKEATTKLMGLNTHVMYVHTKFMLIDPLSDKPVVISGSANFSEASIKSNDENMVIIKGDIRVADIYFTEFMRLFTHYYFRSVYAILNRQSETEKKKAALSDSVFLVTDDSWVGKYAPGSFRRKKVEMFIGMGGAQTL